MNKVILVILGIVLTLSACSSNKEEKQLSDKEDISALSSPNDQILNFSLDGISQDEKTRWNIQGDAVDVDSNSSMIDITKVVTKAYNQQGSVTLTADKGKFDRIKNIVHVESNVVVTNTDGVWLNTNSLDWDANTQQVSTDTFVTLQKDNLQVSGLGANAQPDLKKIVFKEENTVLIQPNTVVTCSGPLHIDYEKNLAIFKEDVIITDQQGRIFGNQMDVFLDPETKKITKTVAVGNVRIERGLNSTFSQKAIYLAEERKVILTGQPTLFIYPNEGS